MVRVADREGERVGVIEMHVQVVQNAAGTPTAQDGQRAAIADPADTDKNGVIDADEAPVVQNLQTSSSDDIERNGFAAATATVAAGQLPAEAAQPGQPTKQQTVVKDDFSKTPRNAPCPCGSGKKFKLCHGS